MLMEPIWVVTALLSATLCLGVEKRNLAAKRNVLETPGTGSGPRQQLEMDSRGGDDPSLRPLYRHRRTEQPGGNDAQESSGNAEVL